MAGQAYITNEEFGSQALPGDSFASLSAGEITRAIVWASSTADSYLRKRYTLPLVSWSEDLKSVVCDLAQYKLLSRRGFKPGSGQDQIAVKRYDDAILWLRSASSGSVEVDCVDSTPEVDEDGSLSASLPPVNFSMTTGVRRRGYRDDGDCE